MIRTFTSWDSIFIDRNWFSYVLNYVSVKATVSGQPLVYSWNKYMKYSILCILCDYHIVTAMKTIVYLCTQTALVHISTITKSHRRKSNNSQVGELWLLLWMYQNQQESIIKPLSPRYLFTSEPKDSEGNWKQSCYTVSTIIRNLTPEEIVQLIMLHFPA